MVKKLPNYHVLRPFLSKPLDSLHLAAISRELGLPHPTIRIWLEKFVEIGVLKKKIKGKMTEYKLNLEHQNIVDNLTVTEKLILIEKCEDSLVLRETVNHIMQNSDRSLIFGRASTDFSAANDIDILIIGKYNEKKIIECEKRVNKEFHIISVPNMHKISKTLKNEIIKKHLLIKGSEEFIGWFIW